MITRPQKRPNHYKMKMYQKLHLTQVIPQKPQKIQMAKLQIVKKPKTHPKIPQNRMQLTPEVKKNNLRPNPNPNFSDSYRY